MRQEQIPTPEATPAELRAALTRIRAMPVGAAWPDDLDAVLAHRLYGPLLHINAAIARRTAAAQARPAPASAPQTPAPHWRPPAHSGGGIDRKRAAAGDLDD